MAVTTHCDGLDRVQDSHWQCVLNTSVERILGSTGGYQTLAYHIHNTPNIKTIGAAILLFDFC